MARRENRVALALDDDTMNRLNKLADARGKKIAVICRDILQDFLAAHEKEINEAQQAAIAYRESLQRLSPFQKNQLSLFPDDEDDT